jgi:hypothetical protein
MIKLFLMYIFEPFLQWLSFLCLYLVSPKPFKSKSPYKAKLGPWKVQFKENVDSPAGCWLLRLQEKLFVSTIIWIGKKKFVCVEITPPSTWDVICVIDATGRKLHAQNLQWSVLVTVCKDLWHGAKTISKPLRRKASLTQVTQGPEDQAP